MPVLARCGRADEIPAGGSKVVQVGDHRIAMAFAIASARAGGPIEITDVANVATSFPGFPVTARQVGFEIESVRES